MRVHACVRACVCARVGGVYTEKQQPCVCGALQIWDLLLIVCVCERIVFVCVY